MRNLNNKANSTVGFFRLLWGVELFIMGGCLLWGVTDSYHRERVYYSIDITVYLY